MHCKVITPERVLFEDTISSITLPTLEGEITILDNHLPLVAGLAFGAARLVRKDEEYFVALSGGFVEVRAGNEVIVLADSADRAEELDLVKIEAAHEVAVKLLAEKRFANDLEYASVAALLERELARLKVARHHQHRRSAK